MARFLWQGGGFAGLVASFGRPSVRRWAGVSCLPGSSSLPDARFATLDEQPIAAEIDPAEAIAQAAGRLAAGTDRDGACLSALAVDTTAWTLATFSLWAGEPPPDAGTAFELLHLSRPGIDKLLTGR